MKTSSSLPYDPSLTPLHIAAIEGNIDTLKTLIKVKNEDPNKSQINTGMAAIHFASHQGQLNIVRYLCENTPVDPQCTTVEGLTPMHLAAKQGKLDVIRYLVEQQNADTSVRDVQCWKPLDYAIVMGQRVVDQYLLSVKSK